MKKLAIAILFILALILLAFTVLIKSAQAEAEAEDPGIPWGDYRITWRSSDLQRYRLEYSGGSCTVEIEAVCVEPELTAPKVGDTCARVGNQKFDCPGNTQTLRWVSTLKQICMAFIAKLAKCPPCPVCPSGAGPECVMCVGGE